MDKLYLGGVSQNMDVSAEVVANSSPQPKKRSLPKVITPEKKAEISKKNRENYLRKKQRMEQTLLLSSQTSRSDNTNLQCDVEEGPQSNVLVTHHEVVDDVNTGTNSDILHVEDGNSNEGHLHDVSVNVLPPGVNIADLLRNPIVISQLNMMLGNSLSVGGSSQNVGVTHLNVEGGSAQVGATSDVEPLAPIGTPRIATDSMPPRREYIHDGSSPNLVAACTGLRMAASSSVEQNIEIARDSQPPSLQGENIISIAKITPATPLPWKAKVRVVEKVFPRVSRSVTNPVNYLRTILMDDEGTRVQATIFGQDIDVMQKKLPLLERCYISDAIVQPISPDHRIVKNPFQWSIVAKTSSIEEIPYDADVDMINPYNLVSLGNLDNYLNTSSSIDILATVVEIMPMKQINTIHGLSKVQEVLLVDQMLKPVILSLWDQFVDQECVALSKITHERTIIVATRVKVGSYNGISLSTKTSSSVLINPNFTEANELRTWCLKKNTTLQKLVGNVVRLSKGVKEVSEGPTNIISIKEANQSNDKVAFWVKATVMVINFQQKFWYMSCNLCSRVTTTEYDKIFACDFCNSKIAVATPRCRIEAQLDDLSDYLQATLFGENAEVVFGCTATRLMEETNQNGTLNVPLAMNVCPTQEIYFQLKPYIYKRDNEAKRKYNIVEIQMLSKNAGKDRGKKKIQ